MKLKLVILFLLILNQSVKAQIGRLMKEVSKSLVGDKAVQLAKDKLADSFEKRRAGLDTTSFNYSIAFIDKAGMYEHKEKGEDLTKVANNFLQTSKPKTNSEEARGMLDLGEFSYGTGNYALAELYLTAAKFKYEMHSLTREPNYFRSIAALGMLYNTQGRYTQAEEYTRKALELRKEQMGDNSLAYASSLNNLAVLEYDLGRYNEAEKLIEEAAEITAEGKGKESMAYAIHLNNKAIFYNAIGRYDHAIALMQECIDIAGKELKEKSGTYLQLMTNLALIHQSLGQYDEAEKIYKEAIDLQVRRLKLNRKSDPDYAHMLNNLASLYMLTDREEEAGKLLQESLDIYQAKFGERHPATASAQRDMANFYLAQGDYNSAQPLFKKTYDTRKSTLAENHPSLVQSAEDLAIIQWKLGKLNEAAATYQDVMKASLAFIDRYFPPMSEAEKTKYWDRLRPRFHRYFSFVIDVYDQKPELLDQLLSYHMSTKGLLLSSNTRIRNAIIDSGDEELIRLYQDWQDQREQLATYYTYTKEELRDQNVNLDSIESAANRSERLLSEQSSMFAEGLSARRYHVSDLQSFINEEQAVVEIVQLPWFENRFDGRIKYIALIVKKSGLAELVILDNGNQLEERYYKYYKNVIRQKTTDQYSYVQYWKPIEEKLSGVSKIYFSADGIYNQVNMNTMLDESGKFVVEKYNLYFVGNAKDLLESKKQAVGKTAFVLGYPLYGDDQLIAPLPGTREEVMSISEKLKKNNYTIAKVIEKDASEANVKHMKAPNLLHIATHGFFQEDVKGNQSVFGVNMESARNNPLLRSGLMLSGAAYTMKDASFRGFDQHDNGILTAYEAMNLPLSNTNLVVLSACETGVGDVKAGEGVYGLQRAFMVAGAKQLVMSLWKVSDEATQHLMTQFYSEWLSGKDSNQAFRNAQLSLKQKYPHPYYWGAFVMVNAGS